MKLSDLFDYSSYFRSQDEIKSFIKETQFYSNENSNNFRFKKIFETSKQRTYLVNTGNYIFCILDDSRKSKPELRWAEPVEKFINKNDVAIELTTQDKSANTGIINFGENHKNWLYTKSLFPNDNIKADIVDIFSLKD